MNRVITALLLSGILICQATASFAQMGGGGRGGNRPLNLSLPQEERHPDPSSPMFGEQRPMARPDANPGNTESDRSWEQPAHRQPFGTGFENRQGRGAMMGGQGGQASGQRGGGGGRGR